VAYVFPPAHYPAVALRGRTDFFPVRRIYCVGRNYAEHAREMGMDPEREPPFFFAKPADAIVPDGSQIMYPLRTGNLHHEIELVLALGAGGRNIPVETAREQIFGYAVGLDLTRRDLQAAARKDGRPWDTAKGFDQSAPISSIVPASDIGHPRQGRIALEVNGVLRQHGDIADMIWKIPEIVAELSTYFELAPGDLIYTGTPAGVGPIERGDRLEGSIEGVGTLSVSLAA
jgi:fumarylpyruvate hydrolase